MMRKKQLTQFDYNISKTKEVNAKVTVQYIQEQQQLIQKRQNSGDYQGQHNILLNSAHDDIEIENIEYLEDNTNAEEYIEHSEKNDFEDNFYPNAIHCLLDLYKKEYENLNIEGKEINVAKIWRAIAKNMQESLFEFNERQIQQKYLLLREQYFAVHTREDIDNFDYFEQLHDIYKNPGKEDIIKGMVTTAKTENIYYKDEVLLNTHPLENNHTNHTHDFKSDEIVHKEHEFIGMVEKELQAMENGGIITKSNEPQLNEENLGGDKSCYNDYKVDNNKRSMEATTKDFKKSLPNELKSNCDAPPKKKQKIEGYFKINENIQDNCSAICGTEFSLFQYNQQQEKRHQEKLSMLEKYLHIQERVLEQQEKLLQELIKRLPS